MQQLKDLQRHYNWKRKQKDDTAAYLRSPAFLAAVQRADDDPAERARLLIGMLSHVALDPSEGSQVENFLELQGEYLRVWVKFYQVSSIFGIFTVPRTSPEGRQLVQAIRANLTGRLFKAACMHRRLRDKAGARDYRLCRRASAAFSAELSKHEPQWTVRKFQILEDETFLAHTPAALAAAESAKQAIYQPATERRLRREEAVARASCNLGNPGQDWYKFLAEFAMRYMAPQSPAEVLEEELA